MTATFYDHDTMTYKTVTRHGFGWVDMREVLDPKPRGIVHTGEYVASAKHLSCRCSYCRSEHQATSCPNCGAPK